MKIEKLTDNKIRIIINIEELSEKNIDIFNLPSSKEKIYDLFDGILKEAEKQVGFKAQDCRLLIEAFLLLKVILFLLLQNTKII